MTHAAPSEIRAGAREHAAGELDVVRLGHGPPLLLVHGSVEPTHTWSAQLALSERWSLLIPHLRGFGDSPATSRPDFERDAEDLAALLDAPAHVLAFSYGGVAALLVAARHPQRVRSVTVVEPPLFAIAEGVAEVDALRRAVEGPFSGPAGRRRLRESFEAFGEGRATDAVRFAARVHGAMRFLRGARSPSEARPDLEALAAAALPVLVVSGGHHPALETICDRLALATAGERAVIPERGHFVQRAASFNERLERFLTRSGAPRASAGTDQRARKPDG